MTPRRTWFTSIPILFICALGLSLAQPVSPPPGPRLIVSGAKGGQAVSLEKLVVETRITGLAAETRMTMTFFNPTSRILEGELRFPLPAGAFVSGYALDINGQMVDGVVVEKDRAREIFEEIVRRGVDPGMVEWERGNNFKTRVYPVPANGRRTVMVRYVDGLQQRGAHFFYHLPLNFPEPVPQFALRVDVVKTGQPPQVEGGAGLLTFSKSEETWTAASQLTDARLKQDLELRLPLEAVPQVLVEKTPDGEFFWAARAAIDDPRPPAERNLRGNLARLVLFWDASRSRGEVPHDRELQLLEQFLASRSEPEIAVDLVVFRHQVEPARRFTITNGKAGPLIGAIRNLDYDGGTSLAALALPSNRKPADLALLFSDGLQTFGEETLPPFEIPLFAVGTASNTDHAVLTALAERSGGAYLDLTRLSDDEALPLLGRRPLQFLGTGNSGNTLADILPAPGAVWVGQNLVVGRLAGEAARTALRFGAAGRELATLPLEINRKDATPGGLLATIWAQRQIQELSVQPERNRSALTELGQRYGLVTPGTSLLVLDSLDQYVRYQIEPPASLPQWREQYRSRVQQTEAATEQQKKSTLNWVLSEWQARLRWWETIFKPEPKKILSGKNSAADQAQAAGDSDAVETVGSGATSELQGVVGGVTAAPAETRRAEAGVAIGQANAAPALPVLGRHYSGVLTTAPGAQESDGDGLPTIHGSRQTDFSKSVRDTKAPSGSAQEKEASIQLAPWQPDAPYIRVLQAAAPGKAFAAYLDQARRHYNQPGFFLDCADLFAQRQENQLALQILSNLAEFRLDDPALLRILAHRLEQIGQLTLSRVLFERVKSLRPEDPQSWRDLALVEGRLGHLKRALELLAHVIERRWNRFDGIQLIALTEFNQLVPKARQAGLNHLPLDPRFFQLLDPDVRIILTWDADDTDIDLHVVEPGGEEAFYGNSLTRHGGAVSRDMTLGFGPEEYMIRRALPGVYQIKAHYYGTSSQRPLGPVTVQATVFTHFGRPDEKRQAFTLRLESRKEWVEVGAITIGGEPPRRP